MRLLLASVALALMAQPGAAGFHTGNEMLELCQSDNSVEVSYCRGFMSGILGVLDLEERICVPERVTTTQVFDVAMKALRDNLDMRHFSAEVSIAKGMGETFPC